MKSANTIKPNITYLILLIFIFVISYSCGGYNPDGVTGEGSIAFKIQLQDTQDITNKPQTADNQLPRMVAIDCNATSIFTVDATVSDSSGTTLSSGSWKCSAHTGTINNVSAGSNRRVIINGKDSGGIIKYSGEQTGITVTANSTTDAGTITIASVSGVPSAPTSVSASAGNGQATISWNPVVAATSYNIYRSTTSGVNKSNGNRITNKTSPYTDTGRTNGITYYYVVTAVNSYGESSESYQVSALPTTSSTGTTTTGGETTTTIDTTAPSSPSVSINNGAASTTSTSVTLSLLATDNVGVTGYCAKETSSTPSANDTCWTSVTSTTSYSGSVSLTLSSSSGTKTVYVWFKDSAGNVSASASDSITLSTAPSTVTDIDGNVYNTVTIGTQVWMKENLKVTKYRNGDTISTTTADISGETSPKYQWAYNNNESNVATYGRLYTWYAATDSRAVCPSGWHVPTDTEWTTLTDYLGGASVAGGKMKEAGTAHWISPNTGADNSSGFTARPGGYRDLSGTFDGMGYFGYWWSATEYSSARGWSRALYYDVGNAYRGNYYEDLGFSVRCVRD